MPIVVTTKNLTAARSDLCAAFNRATATMPEAHTLGAGGAYELELTLTEVATVGYELTCRITIAVATHAKLIATAKAGAEAPGTDDLAARDCIDAVIRALMVRDVGPLMAAP